MELQILNEISNNFLINQIWNGFSIPEKRFVRNKLVIRRKTINFDLVKI